MMGDIARVYLQCGAASDRGPDGALCNNHTTRQLRLGAGNDFVFDEDGWSVMIDGDKPIVRCPIHAAT